MIFALLHTVLFWFAAMAVDISYIRTVHGQMQRAVDAAAHGALVTYRHGGNGSESIAMGIAAGNQNLVMGKPLNVANTDFTIGYYDFASASYTPAGNFNAVHVSHSAPLGLLFGPLIGRSTATEILNVTVAMRPREIVFVVDVSSGNTAPTAAAPWLRAIDGIAGYNFPEDRVGMVLYQDSFFPNSMGFTPFSYVTSDYANIRSQWQSDLQVCGTGSMPACGGSNPADGLQSAMDMLAGGDPRYAQSIVIISNGDVKCVPYSAPCAAARKNAAQQVADVADSSGISIYPITVQGDATGFAFMESLRRGSDLKIPSLDASNVSELEDIMNFLANNVPIAIVE
ncbi:MAG TPA: VWA domain-containing protein [Myxococcota bacterium]|nr:VWA domain-containing protein [Myxococcota bacterium]